MAAILTIFIRINWVNLTKIAPIIQWIPCALASQRFEARQIGKLETKRDLHISDVSTTGYIVTSSSAKTYKQTCRSRVGLFVWQQDTLVLMRSIESSRSIHEVRAVYYVRLFQASCQYGAVLKYVEINYSFNKLIAKVNNQKNSEMKNFICNQYAERHPISKPQNIKICERVTELEAIRMQYACIFFHIGWICRHLNF